jgi:hypothetical protein
MANDYIRNPHGSGNPHNDLSAEEVRAVLHYEPRTGILYWKVARPKIKRGQIASRITSNSHKGRVVVTYHSKVYAASRLIWLLMTGEWPSLWIDHKDGNPLNNRWDNLRQATPSENSRNRDYSTKMPYRGIMRLTSGRSSGGRWRARISVSPGKRIELGCFGSAEEAYEAYKRAAFKYHGEFAKLI